MLQILVMHGYIYANNDWNKYDDTIVTKKNIQKNTTTKNTLDTINR
jgi:hypothetical protein